MSTRIFSVRIGYPDDSVLPIELEWYILNCLSFIDLLPLMSVCHRWYDIVYDITKKSKINEITTKYLAHTVYHNEQLIDYLYDTMSSKMKSKVCAFFAYLGNLSKVKYCLENGAEWTERAVCYAFYGKQKQLIEKYSALEIDLENLQSIYDITTATFQIRQKKNYLMYQKYYHLLEEADIPYLQKHQKLIEKYGSIVTVASMNHDLNILKKLYQNGHQFDHHDYDQAIIHGNIDILEWLNQCNQIVDLALIHTAIKYEKLDIFDFLYHHYDFETHSSIIKQYVLKYGKLSFLVRLIQYKIIPNSRDALVALTYGNLHMFHFLHQTSYINATLYTLSELETHILLGCRKKLKMENIKIIMWLLKMMPSIASCIGGIAASNNDIVLLEWLINNQYQVDLTRCCYNAVLFNQTCILSYIQKINSEVITNHLSKYIRMAVHQDCFDVVKWLIQYKPFDSQMMQISHITKTIHLHLLNHSTLSIEITKTNKKSYTYLNQMLKN